MQGLALEAVTAVDFNAVSGGRFLYYTGSAQFTLTITSSNYTCTSTAFSSTDVLGIVN